MPRACVHNPALLLATFLCIAQQTSEGHKLPCFAPTSSNVATLRCFVAMVVPMNDRVHRSSMRATRCCGMPNSCKNSISARRVPSEWDPICRSTATTGWMKSACQSHSGVLPKHCWRLYGAATGVLWHCAAQGSPSADTQSVKHMG